MAAGKSVQGLSTNISFNKDLFPFWDCRWVISPAVMPKCTNLIVTLRQNCIRYNQDRWSAPGQDKLFPGPCPGKPKAQISQAVYTKQALGCGNFWRQDRTITSSSIRTFTAAPPSTVWQTFPGKTQYTFYPRQRAQDQINNIPMSNLVN